MTGAEEHPQASTEAREAIERARRAKASTDAVLPLVDDMATRVRAALLANHFNDLLSDTLAEAARRAS